MKKALFLLEDLSLSGSTLTALHIFDAIKEFFKIDVFVLASNSDTDLARLNDYKNICDNLYLEKFPHSMSKKYKIFYNLYEYKLKKKISQLFKHRKYDYFYSHNYFISGPLFKYFSLKYQCKCVFYSLGSIHKVSNNFLVNIHNMKSRKKLAQFCNSFLAISSMCFDENYRCYEKEQLLYDYVDLVAESSHKVFSPKKKVRIGQIGYFDSNKNQLFTLKVLKNLIEDGYDATCVLMGYASTGFEQYLTEIHSYILENNLKERVTFIDGNSDKVHFFDNIDLLCHPSYSEGFSLTVLEAIVRKTPVLASLAVTNELNFNGLYNISICSVDEWAKFIKEESFKKSYENRQDLKNAFVEKIKTIFD